MASLTVQVEYSWEPVTTHGGQKYRFPEPLSPEFREEWSRPAVYRWVFRGDDGCLREALVGEAEDLARCVYQYLNPGGGQYANAKIRQRLVDSSLSGERAELEVLKIGSVSLNGNVLPARDLTRPAVRRLLEQALNVLGAK
ncbi:MAG: hypothetical protein ACP5VE_03720 [Chthonomonadales bacterium]